MGAGDAMGARVERFSWVRKERWDFNQKRAEAQHGPRQDPYLEEGRQQ